MASAERRVETLDTFAAIGGAARGAVRASLRASPRATLCCALAVSAIVHAGLLVAPLAGGGGRAAIGTFEPAPIQVALVRPQSGTVSLDDVAFVATPMAHAAPLPMRAFAHVEWSPATSGARAGTRSGVPIEVSVPAQPVMAIVRIGDEQTQRFAHEFPREVAWPVRMEGEVRARYPVAAREAGREGDVLLWIVVDETGVIEEVKAIEGDDEFARAAIDAVTAARFSPASENGVYTIRYPIALEFRFTLPRTDSAVASAAAGHR